MRELIAGVMAFAALPAAAQDADGPLADPPYYGVACTAHHADWQMSEASLTPPTGTVDTPEGTYVQIFGCEVGGHTVRVNSAVWPVPDAHCGATDDVKVSAWVDGTPVVTNRQAGYYDNCMGAQNSDWKLWRVLVNDRLHLTTCERRIDSDRETPYTSAELKPGETSVQGRDDNDNQVWFVSRCTLEPLVAGQGNDPWFDGKTVKRTPPAVELAAGTADACTVLTPAFAETDPAILRSALAARRLTHTTIDGKPFDQASQDDKDKGEIATYRLDVDNDGIIDTVTSRDLHPDGEALDFPAQLSWTSGASGKAVELGGSTLKTGMSWMSHAYADPVRDDVGFIAVGGKIYVYKADVLLVSSFIIGDAKALEAVRGAQDWSTEATRHLYELHPDGTATEICGWRARKRPEEFL